MKINMSKTEKYTQIKHGEIPERVKVSTAVAASSAASTL